MSLEIVLVSRMLPMVPRRSGFTARFWDALADGVFTTTRCDGCDRLSFPPKPFCPHCWHEQVSWVPLCGEGTLYSHTTVHAAPEPFRGELPYINCIVDLAEGLRVACRFHRTTDTAPVPDGPVRLVVLAYEDGYLFAATAA